MTAENAVDRRSRAYRGETRFRSAVWLRYFLAGSTIVVSAIAIHEFNNDGWSWLSAGLALMAVACAAGAVAALTDGIDLDETSMTIRENFRRSTIARRDIEKVTWAKGVGVSLRLTSGRWIKLPDVGKNSQSLSNSLRAWIKAR